eukprot:scaffold10181_cov120-Isochrysis_galbana.AAC.5
MAVFLKDIEQGKVPLKHVDAIADKSSPVRSMHSLKRPSTTAIALRSLTLDRIPPLHAHAHASMRTARLL